MTAPQPNALAQALRDISVLQIRALNQRVGLVTDADVAAAMPEARRIHAANMALRPDPHDAALMLDLQEWAIERIALNVIARSRGFDVGRITYLGYAGGRG